jgi:sec-independent protein translocase protein TatA
MPFSLGPLEMVFVLVVLLLVFGAKRLPELGSGLGKGIREFKRSMSDMKEEINRPENSSLSDGTGVNQIHRPAADRPQVAAPTTSEPIRRDS